MIFIFVFFIFNISFDSRIYIIFFCIFFFHFSSSFLLLARFFTASVFRFAFSFMFERLFLFCFPAASSALSFGRAPLFLFLRSSTNTRRDSRGMLAVGVLGSFEISSHFRVCSTKSVTLKVYLYKIYFPVFLFKNKIPTEIEKLKLN